MKWLCSVFLCFCLISGLYAEKKVVLISGSTGGIGLATLKAFQEKGWIVWAGCRQEPPESLKFLPNVRWIPLDVTNEEMVQFAIERVLSRDGRIDALVNNAGYAIIGLEESVPIPEVEKLFDVNFLGSLRLIQKVVPYMRRQERGHIINVSSTSGVRAIGGLGIYAASKFALEGLSEALAVSLSPWNIRVSLVEPGMVNNAFADHYVVCKGDAENPFSSLFTEALQNKLKALSREGQACEEVAQLIVSIAETEHPHMRYQTSSKAEETVAKKLVDLSGDTMKEEQTAFFRSLLK